MTARSKRQRTICLNMIVKDESRIIRRCLDTVRPWIDHWVIVDTGSTDGTQDIIREHLKDIPGELHERPWKDFGYNRTEALRLAEGKADYLLLCDADMSLEMSDPAWKSKLDADAYLVTQRHGDGGLRYRNIRLVNARLTGGRTNAERLPRSDMAGSCQNTDGAENRYKHPYTNANERRNMSV